MYDLVDPEKVVNYPLKNDEKGGALFLYGNPNSSQIAICCAGFPDDHSVFQAFASRLAKKNSCFVGVICFPGYDDRPDKPWTSHPPKGYTFQDVIRNIAEAVKALKHESTCKDEAKLTGIFHDWGSLAGALWSNQVLEEEDGSSQLDRLVYFDVLPKPRKDTSDLPEAASKSFHEFLARWLYFVIFAVTNALHVHVAHVVALFFNGISMSLLKILGLHCVREIDLKMMADSPVVKNLPRLLMMMYPYRRSFSNITDPTLDYIVLPRDLKRTPVLYMHGLDKNCHWHDNRALKLLEREEEEGRSISKAIPVENAGHFLYNQQPKICLEEVQAFMNVKKV